MKPGELRDRLERYVALRKAVGFPMRAEERLLRDFVTFVEHRGLDEAVRSQLAVEWACQGDYRGPTTQARRLSVVRGFLAHVRASVPQTEVPPEGLIARNRRPAPYIYTDQEIRALVEAARKLGPTDSLRPHTHATIIGLLAASGLRAGEITRLRLEDVRLEVEPPHLRVLDTKFHKSRLVPLHPSTATALRAYATQRSRLGYDGLCDRFFVSERPGEIRYQSIRRTFVSLVRRLGLGTGNNTCGCTTFDTRSPCDVCLPGIEKARMSELGCLNCLSISVISSPKTPTGTCRPSPSFSGSRLSVSSASSTWEVSHDDRGHVGAAGAGLLR